MWSPMVNEQSDIIDKTDNPPENEEEVFTAMGVFQNDQILVTGHDASTLFNSGFYGELKNQELLILGDVEATNLIERKRLEIIDEETDSPIPLPEVVSKFAKLSPNFWIKYLVYKDLRMRGYVVRIGFEEPLMFRVYPRGGQPGKDPAKHFVAPLTEGTRLPLDTLEHLFAISLSARKQLILAVIDRSGDVTYYRAQEIELK